MASPRQAITRYDLSMTFAEFSAELNRRRYIGHLVFPPLGVGKQSSDFSVIKAESLIPPIEDTERAPRGGYNRDHWEWDKDDYATKEYGVEEEVDDRQEAIYRNEIRAERIARDRTVTRVAQAYEDAAASAAFDTAYFTGAYTAAIGTAWSTAATATPIDDIDTNRETFIDNCGTEPNALVLELKALLACIRTAQIVDVVSYTGRIDEQTVAKLMPQLQEVFQLEKIIVARSTLKNTAGRGQTPTYGRMWNQTYALLCRIYDGDDLEYPEPFLGRTLMWSEEAGPLPGADSDGIGVLTEEYREEAVRGSVIRGRTDYQIKRFYKPAGLLLSNVTA